MEKKEIRAKSPITQKINDLFKRKTSGEMDIIWEVVNLLIYKNSTSSDVAYLYELLGLDAFVTLVSFLDGKTIKLPTKKEMEESLVTALLYYDRKILGSEWEQIKNKYPELNIKAIKYALQIKKLDEFLQLRVYELLKKIPAN